MATMKRRTFLASTGAAMAAASASPADKPAVLGGEPVRTKPFTSWPKIGPNDEAAWMKVLKTGRWNRNEGGFTKAFEERWASQLGSRYCLATANGTSSLLIALNALGIGAGDEVIVPPYTFVATVNAVLATHAMPVFVDTDPNTFQIDARKIGAAITPRTRCIMPVHLGGNAADMDAILATARKHNVPVIEDACQAHLAEWRGKKVSTLGDLGCFSFQASKNLNCGEGGALLTDNEALIRSARSFHNNGRGFGDSSFSYIGTGLNLRMTEFQAALLAEQLTRLDEQSRTRESNAKYLSGLLDSIGGVTPAKQYDGCTRNAYHLYMFRYDAAAFDGLPRDKFLKAMKAEGIPCSGGYQPLNREPFLEKTLQSRTWKRVYSGAEVASWRERNACPANDRLCTEAVWLTQTMLLGPREDMDQIAEAVRKVRKNARAVAAA